MNIQQHQQLQQQQQQQQQQHHQQQQITHLQQAQYIGEANGNNNSNQIILTTANANTVGQQSGFYVLQSNNNNSNMTLKQPSLILNHTGNQTATYQISQPTMIVSQGSNPANVKYMNATTGYVTNSPSTPNGQSTYPTANALANSPRIIIQQAPNTAYSSNSTNYGHQNHPQIQYQTSSQQPSQQQQPQSTTVYQTPQQQSYFININNRMVPIQPVNLKSTNFQTVQTVQQVTSLQQQQQQPPRIQVLNPTVYDTSQQHQQQQQQLNNIQTQPQQQQQQQYLILSNNNQNVSVNNSAQTIQPSNVNPSQNANPTTTTMTTNSTTTTTSSLTNSANLGSELAEKMRTLEQLQAQLRQYQTKILSNVTTTTTNTNTSDGQTVNGISTQQLVLTQQQIQAVLSVAEQTQLQKLILQRKTIEAEIQQLKQKQQSAAESTTVVNVNQPTTVQQQPQSTQLTKQQLLQQVTLKLNSLRSSKTITTNNTANGQQQQQLVLTAEEFEQMKKLMEYQTKLRSEIEAEQQQQQQTTTQQQPQTTTIKLNELSLAEKHKLNELFKNQIEQLKTAISNLNRPGVSSLAESSSSHQQQLKDRYVALVKKQSEIQALINQQEKQQLQQSPAGTISTSLSSAPKMVDSSQTSGSNVQILNGKPTTITTTTTSLSSANNIPVNHTTPTTPKQTPMKIRNVFAAAASSAQMNGTGSPLVVVQQQSPSTTVRTVVINKAGATSTATEGSAAVNLNVPTTGTTTSTTTAVTTATSTTMASMGATVFPLNYAINLHKQHFPHVQFKFLNFEELAQHGVITKQTDEATMQLLKQLDEKASTVINSEQAQSFAKNQVKLVRKYLEQQQLAKMTVRTRINEQLLKDQKLALEPDYKTPFADKTDAIKRLSRYHVFQKTLFEPTEEDARKFDECFEKVSERLLKTADAMKKRFHLFQLRSMQKEVVSSEETMLLKLFVDDLKLGIEEEKRLQKELQEKKEKEEKLQREKQQLLEHQKQSQLQIANLQSPQNSNTPMKSFTTDSPTTIRKLFQMSQSSNSITNNDFVINTSNLNPLKRVHKVDEPESSINNQHQHHNNNNNHHHLQAASESKFNVNKVIKLEASSSSTPMESSYPSSSSSLSSSYSSSVVKSEPMFKTDNQPIVEVKKSNDDVNSFINSDTNSFINDSYKENYSSTGSGSSKPVFGLNDDAMSNDQSLKISHSNDLFDFKNQQLPPQNYPNTNYSNENPQYKFINQFDLVNNNTVANNSSSSSNLPNDPINNTTSTNNNNMNTNLNYSDDNFSNSTGGVINNLSGLDDFMLNEDELAVQSILDF